MRHILDSEGRKVSEGDPDFDAVRISNLEQLVRELMTAVVDLQYRLSRVDDEPLQWPGSEYEPTHTNP